MPDYFASFSGLSNGAVTFGGQEGKGKMLLFVVVMVMVVGVSLI